MSHARFFLASEMPAHTPSALPLTAADLHHAVRVLRVAAGEQLDVVEPSGAVWRVTVASASADAVMVSQVSRLAQASQPALALFQGVAKGDKMDTIVRQGVEVGATLIVPVVTSRSIVRLDAEKAGAKGERWRRIAHAAAEQARREKVPRVADPVTFAEALELLGEFEHTVVLWEQERGVLLSVALRSLFREPAESLALFVGPEGGLSAEEIDALRSRGAAVASLGASILRTETAAVVALGLAAAALQESREPGDS